MAVGERDAIETEGVVMAELLVAIRLTASRLDASSRWKPALEQIGDVIQASLGRRRLRSLDTEIRRPR